MVSLEDLIYKRAAVDAIEDSRRKLLAKHEFERLLDHFEKFPTAVHKTHDTELIKLCLEFGLDVRDNLCRPGEGFSISVPKAVPK